MTINILARTDALGNLVRLELLPGQMFDTVRVTFLINGLEFGVLVADQASDSNEIIAEIARRSAMVVISQDLRRSSSLTIDHKIYKWHHLIENFFGKLK